MKFLISIIWVTAIVLGNPAIAQQVSLEDLKTLYRTQKDTIKLKTIHRITEKHIQQNDSTFKYASIGLHESNEMHNTNYQGIFLNYLCIVSENRGEYEKAIELAKMALEKFDLIENHLWAAGVSREVAEIFISMLMYDSAMTYCMKALEYHEKLEVNPGTLEALSTLASIHELSGNVNQSIEWSQKMLSLAIAHNFPYYQSEAYLNLGNTYDQKGNYDSALYFKLLALKRTTNVKKNSYASLMGNIGKSYMNKGNYDSALYYTQLYYNLSRDKTDPLYRRDQKKALSAIELGQLYFSMADQRKAKLYLDEGIRLSKEIGAKEKVSEAYHTLYRIAELNHQDAEALRNFLSYNELYQEAIKIENQKTIQQLTFRYNTKQKNQEISLLKLENELKESKLMDAQTRYYAAMLSFIVILIVGFLIFNRLNLKQKARLAEERSQNQKVRFKSMIEAEERERKRIAAELHDGLGQLLSTARLNIAALQGNANDAKDKQVNNSIKLLDDAVSEVRVISHNMMPNALVSMGLESAIREQVHMINDAGALKVHLNLPEEKLGISEALSISLYRVIQEILNNAIKYARAKNIWISILTQPLKLEIAIKDDGKGFDVRHTHDGSGIGWGNINSRIEMINGKIDIESGHAKGTSVIIAIPV
ncbi:MAG: sensor histidine kinase [Flammeovirgaceae bacterium]|nr:sensor histidine kinase [Flammeovirgaceae bacterium]